MENREIIVAYLIFLGLAALVAWAIFHGGSIGPLHLND